MWILTQDNEAANLDHAANIVVDFVAERWILVATAAQAITYSSLEGNIYFTTVDCAIARFETQEAAQDLLLDIMAAIARGDKAYRVREAKLKEKQAKTEPENPENYVNAYHAAGLVS